MKGTKALISWQQKDTSEYNRINSVRKANRCVWLFLLEVSNTKQNSRLEATTKLYTHKLNFSIDS